MHGSQPLGEHFRAFATTVERDGDTTYATISRAVADDDEVLSLLDGAPLMQRRPLLLFAAVHFLLLSGVEHALAASFDTVCVIRGLPARPRPADDVATAFTDFCREYRADIEGLIETHTTQTNEIGRCTRLLPGLCQVAARYGRHKPLSLLDLGTSAGLNLLFDDYGYTYSAADGDALTAGVPGAAVALQCDVRGELTALPELRLPAMAERVGLDLTPVDPFSDDEARWLLACVWPDNLPRFERLCAAVANVRASAHPPRLEQGDMLTDLPRVVATVAGDGPLVVFHSWVAAYLTEEEQRTLTDRIATLDTPRPVHHLYCESPFETPGLATPPSPVRREGPDLATALVHVPPGGAAERLADVHHHGKWIRWWPESS